MKKVIALVVVLLTLPSVAQVINKGDVKISNGTTFYISGVDFINDNGSSHTWSNDGQVIFKGDNFTNNGTMDNSSTTGSTEFSGTNEQYIKGTSVAYFNNLLIDNPNNSVIQLEKDIQTNSMSIADGAVDFDFKVNNDLPLYVNNGLTLNGDLRLMGNAQLIQTHTGTANVSGSKYVWVDQQGTTNQYYYNYWSAPVNQSGNWKMMYLRDGAVGDNNTKASYGQVVIANNTQATNDINNEAGSHPVTLNSYWVYGFKNGADGSYSGWYASHLQHTGTVNPAEGYTMKGPGVDASLNAANGGSTTDYESWTFNGTPNDGDYSVTISADHDYLVGNPYPSAFDADQFINDNTTAGTSATDNFNGNLYFWEHTGGNDHFGSGYQGGYAVYNLTGGTAAVSWDGSGSTVGTKTPKRYVPVGQGFMIWAEAGQGGTVTFNNAQRAFELESGSNSVFIRPTLNTDIRIGFTTPLNFHRQLLLGMRSQATDGIDVAWDGPNFDADYAGADVRWLIDNRDFIIQAIPRIDLDTRLPLNVLVDADGFVIFNIDSVTNLPSDVSDIYIEDTYEQSSRLISNGNIFEIYLQRGTYNDRFFLTFRPTNAADMDDVQLENVSAYFDNVHHELVIQNKEMQEIKTVNLYALTGQEILSMNKTSNKKEIRIPTNISTGVYLVRITSADQKVFTKKLIVK